MKSIGLTVIAVASAASATAAGKDRATAEQVAQARAIVGDAIAWPQTLALRDLPQPVGKRRALLNGRDLSGWRPWLGFENPAFTYPERPGVTPIGTSRSSAGDFAMRTIEGRPALWVKGETWGALVHEADLRNYHLRLEYRWGAKRWAPRLDLPPNNGLLYHTHGTSGSIYGTWQPSVEFEILKGSTGMVVGVGRNVRVRTTAALDPSLISPPVRFRLGGHSVEIGSGPLIWNVENGRDAEKAEGEWNVLDLYVLGDRAIHVVNGVPVMMVSDLATVDAAGKRAPLTHGHIQLQSEGAETWFRDITVEPIDHLPQVVALVRTIKKGP